MQHITLLLSLIFWTQITGWSPSLPDIFEASRSGDADTISKLFELNPDTVNAINDNGHSALLLATYHKQAEAVETLITLGAYVDFVCQDGSILHAAVFQQDLSIVGKLLEADADINIRDRHGETPLMMAVRLGNTDLISLFLNKGANPNLTDLNGKSAIDHARSTKNPKIISLVHSRM